MDKNSIKPIFVLFIICAVVSILLAITYSATKSKIDERLADVSRNAQKEVLSIATEFKKVDLSTLKNKIPDQNYDSITSIYEGINSNKDVGYVFMIETKGYGGKINVIVGIKSDGKIESVKFGDNKETPGLGTKAGESPFISQFKGLDTKDSLNIVKRKKNKPEEIEAITGATITSRAVTKAVQIAMDAYQKL